MKKYTALLVLLMLVTAATADAQNKVLFDANGFEGPTYTAGPLPGQDGWIDDSSQPTWTPPTVMADPTGSGMGQVVMFDPPGNGSPTWGWIGAARPAGPSTGSLVVVEWYQYRDDLLPGATPPDGDNFWYADGIAWDAWWAMQWDQNLQASHQEFIFGSPISGQTWQHVRYLFNFQAQTVSVEVDGSRYTDSMSNPPGFPSYTQVKGVDFEAEPTPPGQPDDAPIYLDNVKFHEVSLMTDANEVIETAGGQVLLYLDAGQPNANRQYVILGSITGTSPGTPLPGGMVTLPLNWDIFTNLVINLLNSGVFFNFLGQLDANGYAVAVLTLGPVSGATGLVMDFAFTLPNPYDFVSNPVDVTIVP